MSAKNFILPTSTIHEITPRQAIKFSNFEIIGRA